MISDTRLLALAPFGSEEPREVDEGIRIHRERRWPVEQVVLRLLVGAHFSVLVPRARRGAASPSLTGTLHFPRCLGSRVEEYGARRGSHHKVRHGRLGRGCHALLRVHAGKRAPSKATLDAGDFCHWPTICTWHIFKADAASCCCRRRAVVRWWCVDHCHAGRVGAAGSATVALHERTPVHQHTRQTR